MKYPMKHHHVLRDIGAAVFTITVATATFLLTMMAQARAQTLPDNVPFHVKSSSSYSSSANYAPAPTPYNAAPAASGDFVPVGMPQVQSQNGATFITGGVGDEERSAMESVKGQYNLTVMSAAVNGAFAGEAQVAISNHSGEEIINVMAGPLLYVNLPAGTYKLVATNPNRGDQVRSQSFTVGKGKRANVHLSWK